MNKKNYESPQATIYRFDDNDLILTASGAPGGGPGGGTTEPVSDSDYAARALNDLMGGTNTTIEK